MTDKIPVDLWCDLQSPSGYSAHARELVRALHPFVDLRIEDHKHDRETIALDPDEHLLFAQLGKKDRPAKVRIQFETPEFFRPRDGVINIGFTQWETTRIVDFDVKDNPRLNWVKQMNLMQEMWTSCNMAAAAFQNTGVTVPCSVLQGPMDVALYRPGREELAIADLNVNPSTEEWIPRENRPVVLGMVAQWTIRKNIPGFLIPVLSRFKRDEVTILLKTYGSVVGDRNEDDKIVGLIRQTREMVGNPEAPRIVVVSQKLTDEEVAQLYASMDIYVNTSRGEGYCMPVIQAMASHVVPVSCGFSAPSDYVECRMFEDGEGEFATSNGFLVDYFLEPAVGMRYTPWYRHDQDWGLISASDLVRKIKVAIQLKRHQPATWHQMQQNARQTVIDKMSHEATGRRALKLIEDALERDVVRAGA